MSVPNAKETRPTKKRKSTTSIPLSPYYGDLKAGMSTYHGSILGAPGFKYYVTPATATKPRLKMKPEGGIKHDAEKPRTDLISPIAMIELAKVLTFGSKKYEARNWEKGLAYSRAIGAILRHTWAYLRGETNDPETGLSHMAHVLCEAMFLVHFETTKPEFDDRPRY